MHRTLLKRHVSSLVTTTFSTAAIGLCSPALVFAHPGHGATPADAPEHYLVEPWHAVPVLLGVIVVTLLVRQFRGRRTESETQIQMSPVKSERDDV